MSVFFGEPWPSGVCEDATQVPTPVGHLCAYCMEPIQPGQQGSYLGRAPVHRECSLRSVMGGIGHHEDHNYWCKQLHDPDGGRTYRQSALEVWARFTGQ